MILPKPGEGSSGKSVDRGWFDFVLIGTSEDGRRCAAGFSLRLPGLGTSWQNGFKAAGRRSRSAADCSVNGGGQGRVVPGMQRHHTTCPHSRNGLPACSL